MVIAPEHPFVERLTTPEQAKAVKEYCEAAARKSDLDRTELAKEKTGVFTGSHAINPVNGKLVPIWIADYVLISYGTGAIVYYTEVNPMPKAANKWNTMEVTAKGRDISVKLNGQETARLRNGMFEEGPFTLQYGAGVIKWRKVAIKPLSPGS